MSKSPLTTIVMYDVTGAATSPYDSAAGVPSTWKTNSNNSDMTDLPVITPSAPSDPTSSSRIDLV